ncbi:hypothetical protein JL722_3472 [Aureococcus anophagefferens]|nr:hypothetical protein JL722_3472 [Aureococcus anophagefferens]
MADASDDPTEATISEAVVLKLLSHAAEESGAARPRINQGAIKATVELLRLFVVQARARAEGEAAAEGDDAIRPEHVEAAMPELFADF